MVVSIADRPQTLHIGLRSGCLRADHSAAGRRGRSYLVVPPEHGDQLAPEARPADAVEQEVDGVVCVGDQVDDRPHHVELYALQVRLVVTLQQVDDDQVDGDGRCGEEEGERDDDQNHRHAGEAGARSVRVAAAPLRVPHHRHPHQDRRVAADQDDERDH